MRISDWSSDVCSSDLPEIVLLARLQPAALAQQIGQRGLDLLGVVGGIDAHQQCPDVGRAEKTALDRLDRPDDQLVLIAVLRHALAGEQARSEERRVGKECGRPWRSRWSPSE